MRRFVFIVLSLLTIVASTSAQPHQNQARAERLLFIGNSLTYVGNLPAAFATLANANGKKVEVDFLVRGGATLNDRLVDGLASASLKQGNYKYVILQERGGELLGAFGPEARCRAIEAINQYSELATLYRTKLFYLGTYQPKAEVSRRMIAEDRQALQNKSVEYIEISETLGELRSVHPEYMWFSLDNTLHPGADLVLLEAVKIYWQIYAQLPEELPLQVIAPIYSAKQSPNFVLQSVTKPESVAGIPGRVDYSREKLSAIVRHLKERPAH